MALCEYKFKRLVGSNISMTRQKKLSNKTGDSVEIKEEGKDVTVTVQYTMKVEPTVSTTEDNFNDLVSVYERTGFTEELGQ